MSPHLTGSPGNWGRDRRQTTRGITERKSKAQSPTRAARSEGRGLGGFDLGGKVAWAMQNRLRRASGGRDHWEARRATRYAQGEHQAWDTAAAGRA